jgi:hypothetical protein
MTPAHLDMDKKKSAPAPQLGEFDEDGFRRVEKKV